MDYCLLLGSCRDSNPETLESKNLGVILNNEIENSESGLERAFRERKGEEDGTW